jgi:hypothetical protein
MKVTFEGGLRQWRWLMRLYRVMCLAAFLGLSAWPPQGNSEMHHMSAASGGQTVEMRANEFTFEPEQVTVKPGLIRFVVQNVGELRHVLTVEWEGGHRGSFDPYPSGPNKTTGSDAGKAGLLCLFLSFRR